MKEPKLIPSLSPNGARLLTLAKKEAYRLNHQFIGTEHLLIALTRIEECVPVIVLKKMNLDLETIRMEVEKLTGTGPVLMEGPIPYTPRAMKILKLAEKEAQRLGCEYTGTEHILLGLLIEGDGVAGRVLREMDLHVDQVRQEILRELGSRQNPKTERIDMENTGTQSKETIELTVLPVNIIIEALLNVQKFSQDSMAPFLSAEKILQSFRQLRHELLAQLSGMTWEKEEIVRVVDLHVFIGDLVKNATNISTLKLCANILKRLNHGGVVLEKVTRLRRFETLELPEDRNWAIVAQLIVKKPLVMEIDFLTRLANKES